MKSFSSLSEIRSEIDRLDDALLKLLSERMQCSLAVAEVKKSEGAETVNFYRPEREAQILRRMTEQNQGPLDDESVRRLFREIISSSLALEEPMTVAYLGPEATFTHAATTKHFGSAVNAIPRSGIMEVFRAVETGQARFGVVPVENSTEGMINRTLDLLVESKLRICGECRLRIEHNLLGKQQSFDGISSVHAHPQALAQCRRWLDKNLPAAKRVDEDSNAFAAKLVAEQIKRGDTTSVAIAGLTAAQLYELDTIEKNIEDVADNTTRFFVIGDADIPASGKDSTSLLVSVSHKPGSLRRILKPFEDAGVSLTRIESRPSRTSLWSYNFFIDIDGHRNDALLKPVLAELADESQLLRVLGSYPSAL